MGRNQVAFYILFGWMVWGLLSGQVQDVEARQVLQPRPNGLITQGDYLFCGDNEGKLHLLYRGRPILTDMGVYSGLNGYTPPENLIEKEVVREDGKIIFSSKVRGHDIRFEQTATIVKDRIRIAVRRIGRWPDQTWGAFKIWLPLDRHVRAEFRADGQLGNYPANYRSHHRFPSGIERLETYPDGDDLNLIFESQGDGESLHGFTIADERRFGSLFYAVSINIPTQGQQGVVAFSLNLPQLPVLPPRRAVRWSQIGYPLAGEKFVMLEWSTYAPRPPDGVVLENRQGQVVRQGSFGKRQTMAHMQGSYAAFDFSAVDTPGEYRVKWSGGASGWFPIRRNVFENRLWHPTLDYFIPFAMCHADVRSGQRGTGHPRCHRDDGIRVQANRPGPDGYIAYESAGTPHDSGGSITLSRGGWHDAGDYDINVPAQAFTVWILALAYEEFGLNRDVATLEVGLRSFNAERSDGHADILQQVTWGALWLLDMQQANGRVYNGVCADDPQRGGRPLGQITDGKPGTGDERRVYVDYHADQQLNYVIGMAAAGRVLKRTDPELARRCLKAARKAFAFFGGHREVYRHGSYTADEIKAGARDASVIAAAVELYLSTGDNEYLAVIEPLASTLETLDFAWPSPTATSVGGFRYVPPFLARIHPHLADGRLKELITDTCRRAAELNRALVAERPWPFNPWHFNRWGNNAISLSRVFDIYWLSRIAPRILPPESALRNMYWLFGLHPLSDTVFVCGLGYPEPRHLYNGHLQTVHGDAPASIPGAVVPGMGGFRSSGVIAYMDEPGSYGNNEATIYTQAMYVFAVNAMRKMGF